jgi:hypothetical protein
MRGRLAIPIRDRSSRLLAYCGRALRNERPTLTFPHGFDPAGVVFSADRITGGQFHLVRDPLRVLAAHDSGIDNVVAFLTEGIAPQQLEMLAAVVSWESLGLPTSSPPVRWPYSSRCCPT